MGPAENRICGALVETGLDPTEIFSMIEELSHEWAEGIRRVDLPESRDRHWVRFGVNIAADELDRMKEH